MPLDRQSIEKRDFPTGPDGYDRDAVDAHLTQIANEVEESQTASPRRSGTLAASASEQVRAIVEAAENSAAEIQRQATAQARDYMGRVTESAQAIRQRLHDMEHELSALLEGRPPAPSTPAPEGAAAAPDSGGDDLAGGLRATGSPEAADPPADAGDDVEGARLIALNMALNGTSREETDRYLSENFSSLGDRARLLDEVYSSVQS